MGHNKGKDRSPLPPDMDFDPALASALDGALELAWSAAEAIEAIASAGLRANRVNGLGCSKR